MTVKQRQTRTTRVTTKAVDRPKRIPLSGKGRNLLAVENEDPNFKYRWVNDKEGRIERFKLAGYEFVTHDVSVGDKQADSADGVDSIVTKKVGGGIVAYLMRIKREWHEEDLAAKQKAIDDTEESMFRSLNNNKEDDASNYGNVTFKRE